MLGDDQKTADTSASSRNESVKKCITSLVHACTCRDANCRRGTCHKMKKVIQHTKHCKRRQTAGSNCAVCKQLIALCCYHAKHCTQTKCQVRISRIKGYLLSRIDADCELCEEGRVKELDFLNFDSLEFSKKFFSILVGNFSSWIRLTINIIFRQWHMLYQFRCRSVYKFAKSCKSRSGRRIGKQSA